ncbi:unnamed protein product, partial [Cladocopium goreaui]
EKSAQQQMLFLRLLGLCLFVLAQSFGGSLAIALIPEAPRCEDQKSTCEVHPEAVPQHTLVQKTTATRREFIELAEVINKATLAQWRSAGLTAAIGETWVKPEVAEVARFMHLGRQEADRLRGALGVAAAAAPAGVAAGGEVVVAAGAGGDAGQDGDGRVWVLAEMVMGKKIGDRVVPPVGHPCDGDVGLMRMVDSEGIDKPRLIHRVAESELSDFCDVRIGMARLSESCEGTDRAAGEDARTLEVKYGFNGERHRSFRESVKELQQTEFEDFPLEPRRRQLIADAHASSPGQPSYLGAEHYLGDTYKAGGGIVVPALTDYVSRKMQAQSQILKEKRKLAEVTGGKGGKGKPSSPPKAPPQGKPSGGDLPLIQCLAIQDIIAAVKRLGAGPPADNSGASKALRVAASGYLGPEVSVGDVVGMDFSCLSLPSVGTAGVDLLSALDEPTRGVVSEFEDYFCLGFDVTREEAALISGSNSCDFGKDLCEEAKRKVTQDLGGLGFSIHEDEPASTSFFTLGGEVDGEGYGICERQLGCEAVGQLGRWNERWRFRRLPPEEWAPRRRAMGLDPIADVETVLGGRSARVLSSTQMGVKVSKAHTCRVLKKNTAPSAKVPKVKSGQLQNATQPVSQAAKKRVVKVELKKKQPREVRVVSALKSEEVKDAGKRAQLNRLTILEQKSISTEVRHQYQSFLLKFESFCRDSGLKWPLVKDVDAILADFLDVMFLDNRPAAEGEKVVAAVEFNNVKLKGCLVRSKRALRGWRKERPPQSRLPLPRLVAAGMAMVLASQGLKSMALKVMLDHDTYLRPGESIDIRCKDVIPPVAGAGKQYRWYGIVVRDIVDQKPDKAGIYDNTIALNSPGREYLGDLMWQQVKIAKKTSEFVFQFTAAEFRKKFQAAGERLQLKNLHPYQCRHGGASEDLNSGDRKAANGLYRTLLAQPYPWALADLIAGTVVDDKWKCFNRMPSFSYQVLAAPPPVGKLTDCGRFDEATSAASRELADMAELAG